MLYGKHFASMYEGSMVGAGSHVFAVMGYVIANMVLDKRTGFQVRLNAQTLHTKIGDTVERMQTAIDFLCAPDENTTTPGHEGRRLIKLSSFDYQVVNGAYYFEIKNAEDKRAKDRARQARHRAEKSAENSSVPASQNRPSLPSTKSRAARAEKEYQNGNAERADEIAAEGIHGQ